MSDRRGGVWGQRRAKLRLDKQEVNVGASTLTQSCPDTPLSVQGKRDRVSDLGVGVAFQLKFQKVKLHLEASRWRCHHHHNSCSLRKAHPRWQGRSLGPPVSPQEFVGWGQQKTSRG